MDWWREVYRHAGIVGVNPDPLTFRELLCMSEGRMEEAWTHTSPIMSILLNHWRNPATSSEYPLDYWNPFRKGKLRRPGGVPLTPAVLHGFKNVLPHFKG